MTTNNQAAKKQDQPQQTNDDQPKAPETKLVFDLATYKASHGGTTSGVIRGLHGEGKSRSDIVKLFDAGGQKIRYQHVRNVLITPIKKAADKTTATK